MTMVRAGMVMLAFHNMASITCGEAATSQLVVSVFEHRAFQNLTVVGRWIFAVGCWPATAGNSLVDHLQERAGMSQSRSLAAALSPAIEGLLALDKGRFEGVPQQRFLRG